MKRNIALIFSFLLIGCAAETAVEEEVDYFTVGGAADKTGPCILVPESSFYPLEPNDELLEEQLWFEPYVSVSDEPTINENGEIQYNITQYREDDAWYQVIRYVINIEEAGLLVARTESEDALDLHLYQRATDGAYLHLDNGTNYISFDIPTMGEYYVIIKAPYYPRKYTAEDAHIDYILRTTFTPVAG